MMLSSFHVAGRLDDGTEPTARLRQLLPSEGNVARGLEILVFPVPFSFLPFFPVAWDTWIATFSWLSCCSAQRKCTLRVGHILVIHAHSTFVCPWWACNRIPAW